MKDFKYLAAFSIPLVTLLGFSLKGAYLYMTPIYSFAIIPLLEIMLPVNESNFSKEEALSRSKRLFFDALLLLNVPIVFGLLFYALNIVSNNPLNTLEFIGIGISMGIVLSVNGINVGHELGHRYNSAQRFFGKLLLLPSLYMHFFIEHNFGHHLHVATKEDPATARYNQPIYSFYFTSITRQFINSWTIQIQLLKTNNRAFFSFKNDMLWYTLIQIIYLAGILIVFGTTALIFAIFSAFIGILMLETVNYIEHYGLLRSKTESGRYERVTEYHSWNSNHVIGRIVLYELTRHSDHHYKSNKKYQILDYLNNSPQLPYGYPTSMVIALIPPLWFKVMNKRIPKHMIT